MNEPVLHADDVRLWASWTRTALLHSRTTAHRRAVDEARRVIDIAMKQTPSWACMWSAGKDSTAMTHLIRVDRGIDIPVFSEKDDLDYPGEREYIGALAQAWGLDLRIITPAISPAQWMADNCAHLDGDTDLHSRSAELSKACFYGVVEAATEPFGGVFLGLRQGESRGRKLDRVMHHASIDGRRVLGLYQYKSGPRAGKWKATPIGAWSGLDVYAYLLAHGIEVLHVYRCIAFMHAREPWHVRKSWWVPGSAGRYGNVAWLRHYYPSLFQQLCEWMPKARMYV